MILLFGTAVKNRPLALFGATFVVLLNIGRLAAGAVNLAVVPLRDGLNTRKIKKPVRRVVEPVLTIGLVVLAFTFIPWLSSGRADQAGASPTASAPRPRASRRRSRARWTSVVEKAGKIDVEKLGAGPARSSRDSPRTRRRSVAIPGDRRKPRCGMFRRAPGRPDSCSRTGPDPRGDSERPTHVHVHDRRCRRPPTT